MVGRRVGEFALAATSGLYRSVRTRTAFCQFLVWSV